MGCGSSMDTNSVKEDRSDVLGLQDPVLIVQEYMRLDVQISKLEAACPGPRMATAEAWIEHLQAKQNELIGLDSMITSSALSGEQTVHMGMERQPDRFRDSNLENDIQILSLNNMDPVLPLNENAGDSFVLRNFGKANGFAGNDGGSGAAAGVYSNRNILRNTNDLVASTPNKDLANLALNLGVISDVNKASTHEDFFANLSESALYLMSLRYYNEILEHTKVRMKKLVQSYAELNELYLDQDGIIAFISGGTYISRLEESIDAQLETARDARDKLGSTMEQWRICGTLLRACANSATLSLKQWRQLPKIINPWEKIQTALECRSSLHASLISLDCAQLALPHVAMKYISQRQILAVRHCNVYMITDIANVARYEHTSKVFTAYESNVSKATTWLYETFSKTLRRDFEKAEDTVRTLAKTLRDHREEIFTAIRR